MVGYSVLLCFACVMVLALPFFAFDVSILRRFVCFGLPFVLSVYYVHTVARKLLSGRIRLLLSMFSILALPLYPAQLSMYFSCYRCVLTRTVSETFNF